MIINPIALGKAKIVYNFGLSKCSRGKDTFSSASVKTYVVIPH